MWKNYLLFFNNRLKRITHLVGIGVEVLVPFRDQRHSHAVHLRQGVVATALTEEGYSGRDVDDYLTLGRVGFGRVDSVEHEEVIGYGIDFAVKKTFLVLSSFLKKR